MLGAVPRPETDDAVRAERPVDGRAAHRAKPPLLRVRYVTLQHTYAMYE